MFKVKGYIIGIIEILLFLYGSETLRKYYYPLGNIDTITYFWIMMTILTMYWECAFICQYDYVADLSNQYIVENKNVWESSFDLSFIIPWKLSPIFYADYAAYADREYMLKNRDWSRIIEGTHAIFCGLFSTMAIINKKRNLHNKFLITLAVSMGSQLMNSILYMCSYFIELNEPYSINYNSEEFPAGYMLYKRPFMWVNIFWTVMPVYVIWTMLIQNQYGFKKQ
jgi:hypothetical protein